MKEKGIANRCHTARESEREKRYKNEDPQKNRPAVNPEHGLWTLQGGFCSHGPYEKRSPLGRKEKEKELSIRKQRGDGEGRRETPERLGPSAGGEGPVSRLPDGRVPVTTGGLGRWGKGRLRLPLEREQPQLIAEGASSWPNTR